MKGSSVCCSNYPQLLIKIRDHHLSPQSFIHGCARRSDCETPALLSDLQWWEKKNTLFCRSFMFDYELSILTSVKPNSGHRFSSPGWSKILILHTHAGFNYAELAERSTLVKNEYSGKERWRKKSVRETWSVKWRNKWFWKKCFPSALKPRLEPRTQEEPVKRPACSNLELWSDLQQQQLQQLEQNEQEKEGCREEGDRQTTSPSLLDVPPGKLAWALYFINYKMTLTLTLVFSRCLQCRKSKWFDCFSLFIQPYLPVKSSLSYLFISAQLSA